MCRQPFLHARASSRVTVVESRPTRHFRRQLHHKPYLSGIHRCPPPPIATPVTCSARTGIRCTGTTTPSSPAAPSRPPRITARAHGRCRAGRARLPPPSPLHAYSGSRAAPAALPRRVRASPCHPRGCGLAFVGATLAVCGRGRWRQRRRPGKARVSAVELSRPWARSVAGKTTRWKRWQASKGRVGEFRGRMGSAKISSGGSVPGSRGVVLDNGPWTFASTIVAHRVGWGGCSSRVWLRDACCHVRIETDPSVEPDLHLPRPMWDRVPMPRRLASELGY